MNAIGYINQSEYEPRFWNMARCRSGQDDRLSTGYNTTNGTYTLPATFGKKLEQSLSRESLFRGMATVIHAYGNDYTLYAKDTDDLAQFVEEGGLIPVYDGIDDFTVSKIGSHKLAVFVKLDERHARRYEKMKKRYEAIEAELQRRKEQNDRISAFSAMLAGQSEMPIEFNDDLWLAAVDHATVNADETVTFTFKSGIEITEQM